MYKVGDKINFVPHGGRATLTATVEEIVSRPRWDGDGWLLSVRTDDGDVWRIVRH